MKSWVIVTLVFAVIGVILVTLLVLFVAFRLPEFLEYERENHPPGTNFAPVQLTTTEGIDITSKILTTIDGVNIQPGMRILLRNQTDSRQNGVWVVPTADEQWTRANDMRTSKQLVDGAHIYTTHGLTNRGQTFVLRVLSRQKKHARPGEIDMYFPTILEHLFGEHKQHHVLHMDERGLAKWSTSTDIAKQAMNMIKERGWDSSDTNSLIPETIHIVYGLWDNEDEDVVNQCIALWKRSNPNYEYKVWNRERCEQLLRSEFSNLITQFESMRPVMQCDLMRWLILYSQGGYCVDVDVVPARDMNLTKVWLDQQARMILIVESEISEYECESLNRFSIRNTVPCTPGTRIGSHFVGCCAHHPFVHFVLQHIQRFTGMVGESEYDVVFASGSDAVSHVYRTYGKDFSDIRIINEQTSKSMFVHERAGSWKRSGRSQGSEKA